VASPEFMRGARLVELGQTKGCNLNGPGAPGALGAGAAAGAIAAPR